MQEGVGFLGPPPPPVKAPVQGTMTREQGLNNFYTQLFNKLFNYFLTLT